MTAERTYYKLDIGGIVYLIDPTTAIAYTYDLTDPTEIGKVIWTDPKLAPRLELRSDWTSVMAAKLACYNAAVVTVSE